jgi:hypothetical protein
MRSLAREPLVHFLLLGALLFALDAWLRPTTSATGEIVVSEARVRSLAQNFSRAWQRPPSREEIDGLVEDHIREEVLVREALALGLDRDDTIIRRRLRQKIEFVSEEAAALARPTDEDLAAYLAAHADAFRVEPRATFTQVYLDPRKRAKSLEADTKRLLDALNGNGGIDPAQAGDGLLMLEPRYEDVLQSEIGRLFGAEFAAALVKLPAGAWVGPIESGYGAHLVKLEALTPGGTPTLAEVRPLVEREWANARRQQAAREFYEKLRAKYTVTVRMPEAAKP